VIFFTSILSYLIGSIPFAYILIKIYVKQDIRIIGSGNVGAMNSYETTGKKWIGIVVFFLDMLKGLAAVLIVCFISENDFLSVALSVIFAVVGHNYSIFLKFKGGRGLATAVGVGLATFPLAVVFWGIFWLIGIYILKKDLFIANAIALICSPIAFYFLPDNWILSSSIFAINQTLFIKSTVALLCAVIFLAHIEPLKQIFNKKDAE